VEDLPDEDQMKDFIGDIDFDDDFDVSEAQVSTMLLHLL